MSLRLRLTLLYSTLAGGVLLVFAAAVIYAFNALLFDQIDNTLETSANVIISEIKMGSLGRVEPDLSSADINSDVYVQVLGLDNQIQSSLRSLPGFTAKPFDPISLRSEAPVFREVNDAEKHLRVFTVPLEQKGQRIWTLQLAVDLYNFDQAHASLTNLLSVMLLVAMLFFGVIAWFTLGQNLNPLKAITDTAEQINRADDLSRRIPYSGAENDEIGNLVSSFNQTLERLEALFTSQQRLLADVSHELRTPLTVIKGNVDLMRRMKILDDESLTSIDQEAGRLTRLVGGLLMLAQAESGRLTLNMKLVELDLLLTEVFQEMSILAQSKVHVHLNDIDQVFVNGDRDRLKQVLINLAANAIQYTPHGGDVFLSLEKISEQARIIVRDTGPGIPAEDLPHIFERFYRAEKSRTRGKTTGFGLGLSIAHWIIEQHGGRIEVVSKEGKGTTFAIWLPVFSAKAMGGGVKTLPLKD